MRAVNGRCDVRMRAEASPFPEGSRIHCDPEAMARVLDLDLLSPWLSPRDPAKDRILDAFEEAAVIHGVQGASFARIAEAGTFHRSLIQHHFVTRANLVEAALDRIVEVYLARMAHVIKGAPPEAHLGLLLDWMLAPFSRAGGQPRMAQVVDAFVALANVDPAMGRRMLGLYERFAAAIEEALRARHPDTTPAARRKVAFGVVCLSFGRAGLETLGMDVAGGKAAREMGDALVRTLA
jgi:AcrR family transcriptional regulator